jgi:pyrroline-5-carboxylate reductase
MQIRFIGGGNMASALIGGLLRGTCSPDDLRVVEINPQTRAGLKNRYGVHCYDKTGEAARDGDIVIFAVKPQQMEEAARHSGLAKDENLVISIAAGITLTSLGRWLGGHTRLVRAMPNTPALIGEGITGLYAVPQHISDTDKRNAETILDAVGSTVWISDADKMDAVTAVSGSGPAYVFYFMEAFEQAAAELGLSRETAHELALHTFAGAAKLALASADPVSALRERVTSKGGTTEAALKSMASDRVQEAIVRAIHAANERSRELGKN